MLFLQDYLEHKIIRKCNFILNGILSFKIFLYSSLGNLEYCIGVIKKKLDSNTTIIDSPQKK